MRYTEPLSCTGTRIVENASQLNNLRENFAAGSMIESMTSEGFSDPTLKRADLHCHSRFSVFKYFKRA
ncbi:MAG TPA: hypothetical protein VGQ76_01855, partial [Thermoanaerobaculia bacterium]|nr:hypothetical protein [Thermoanaerobaculia bacterium]